LYKIISALVFPCLVLTSLLAQQPVSTGSSDIEKDAKELFELDRYDKAVPILERATAEHAGDVKLLSLLGVAYLYSANRGDPVNSVTRARANMEKAIENGGEAVLLVSRAKPQTKLTRGDSILSATPGELRISKGWISFVPGRGDTGATGHLSPEDLKECGPNHSYGKDSNSFHIKSSKENIDLRPLHFSKDEAQLACALAEKFLNLKTVK
jgi:hypothetical protein